MAYVDELLAREETILLRAHRHILYLVVRIGLYILAALVLWILAVIAWSTIENGGRIIAAALVLVSLYFVGVAVYRFLAWNREQYLITNYRIIQVEGIVRKRTFDTALEKVNDVLMTQSILGRMFGFGNIKIVAGSDTAINDLTAIADPFTFKRTLVETKMQLGVNEGPGRPRSSDGLESARLLSALVELRDSGVITAEEYEERKQSLFQRT